MSVYVGPSLAPAASNDDLINVGLSVTASSNILTIALKQADGTTNPGFGTASCMVSFRSNTATSGAFLRRTVTSALSQTILAGGTVGLGAQAQDVYLYLIDSDGAGTLKLGASACLYNETDLQTTVAESFSTTATNASPAVFTATAHGMTNNDAVRMTGTVPTGFVNSTVYYVVSAATNTYSLAATPGGTAINSSSTGSSIITHYCGYKLTSAAVYTNKPIRYIGKANATTSATGNWQSVATVSPPQDIPLRQDISMRLTNSATTISAVAAVITFTNIANDPVNMIPNKITAIIPMTGSYAAHASISHIGGVVGGNIMTIAIRKNGTNLIENRVDTTGTVGAGGILTIPCGDTVNLLQNDLLDVTFVDSNVSPAIVFSTSRNFFSISKTGN